MRKKVMIATCIVISIVLIVCYSEFNAYSSGECQQCVLAGSVITGEIEDIVLKEEDEKKINDLKWDLQANPSDSAKEGFAQDTVAKCLAKVFIDRDITVKIADQDIVKVEDNIIVPMKKGTTSAMISVAANITNHTKCGPPSKFEDEITITVE